MTSGAQKPAVRHPLVQAYLADLDRALTGSEERERAETLSAITEHLDQRLSHGADEAEVRRVLGELGSVDTIADTATPQAAVAHEERSHPLAAIALASAVAAAVLLIVMPFVALPLAVLALTVGLIHLITRRPGRGMAVAGVILATATLLASIVLAFTLFATDSGEPQSDPAQPVET
ncbi:MAG: DUF1700 domain-containing protein [Actinomycetia bacterium]|nr:DUF1700 domain-containing protein [Actinomycetes bacterium]